MGYHCAIPLRHWLTGTADRLADNYINAAITGEVTIISHTVYFNCIFTSGLALAVYEFIITFGQEVRTGWQRKLTLTSLLLVSTRWVMVAGQIMGWAAGTTDVCSYIFSYSWGASDAVMFLMISDVCIIHSSLVCRCR